MEHETICNCNDEFKTEPCPVHSKGVKIDNSVILTDVNLVPEQYRRWEGLVFKCPKCQNDSIMDFSKFCGNCGIKVKVRSKILTDVINKLTQDNKAS